MLRNTFCHIPGIGPRIEQRMWSTGILSWDEFLQHEEPPFPRRRVPRARRVIRQSLTEIDQENATYFERHLPSEQHWRLYPEFRHSMAYLDIETSGDPSANVITTISVYDGTRISCYVRGRNLEDFRTDIARYKLIVTYSGKAFDVPVLESTFGIRIGAAHIDLRYVLKSLGFTGGLKSIEKQFGIDRGDLAGLDGYWAVLLWRDFVQTGNERALETLLAYNILDVVNLEALMVEAYNRKLERTPFAATHRVDLPDIPESPFKPDVTTIGRIKQACFLR